MTSGPVARARDLLTELLHVRPAPGSQWVALRTAVTLLTALSVLAGVGHLEWAPYAAFGTFASVYGGPRRTADRWRLQSRQGLWLVAAVVTGALVATLDERRWWGLPLVVLWAGLASWVSLRQGWRPPGPLFMVFASATTSAIPLTLGLVPVAGAVAMTTATFAVTLGVVEVRVLGATPPDPAPGPSVTGTVRLPVACALAAFVAGLVAIVTGLTHPSWAVTAAVVPFSVALLRGQIVRGVHRLAGTAVGVALAAVLLSASPYPVVVLVLLVATLQALIELLIARNYGAGLVFITPLALLLTQIADPRPVQVLIVSRIIETVLGVTVGMVVALALQPSWARRRSEPAP